MGDVGGSTVSRLVEDSQIPTAETETVDLAFMKRALQKASGYQAAAAGDKVKLQVLRDGLSEIEKDGVEQDKKAIAQLAGDPASNSIAASE